MNLPFYMGLNAVTSFHTTCLRDPVNPLAKVNHQQPNHFSMDNMKTQITKRGGR